MRSIDISREMKALCDVLDLDYNCVEKVVFRPNLVEADVFLRDKDGKLLVLPGATEIARERRTIKVLT